MTLFLFILFVLIFAALFVAHYWVQFVALKRRFNYRITDIWAAMAGLSPSMIAVSMFSESFKQNGLKTENMQLGLAAIIVLSIFQIAGLIVGRIDIELREKELGPITAWTSALSIFTGAFVGILAGMGAIFFAGMLTKLF
jgi:hypothetical protein